MGKVVLYTIFKEKWYMIFRLYTKIQKGNSVHFPNLVCTSFIYINWVFIFPKHSWSDYEITSDQFTSSSKFIQPVWYDILPKNNSWSYPHVKHNSITRNLCCKCCPAGQSLKKEKISSLLDHLQFLDGQAEYRDMIW